MVAADLSEKLVPSSTLHVVVCQKTAVFLSLTYSTYSELRNRHFQKLNISLSYVILLVSVGNKMRATKLILLQGRTAEKSDALPTTLIDP
jgi:hypothetical protein